MKITLLVLFVALTQCSCMVLGGGYNSGSGWFIWPGGFGLLFLILLVFFLIRRR